jgi:hypothetical protein
MLLQMRLLLTRQPREQPLRPLPRKRLLRSQSVRVAGAVKSRSKRQFLQKVSSLMHQLQKRL